MAGDDDQPAIGDPPPLPGKLPARRADRRSRPPANPDFKEDR
jgi:hypothetical protein